MTNKTRIAYQNQLEATPSFAGRVKKLALELYPE
jgi:hypothetical protein